MKLFAKNFVKFTRIHFYEELNYLLEKKLLKSQLKKESCKNIFNDFTKIFRKTYGISKQLFRNVLQKRNC